MLTAVAAAIMPAAAMRHGWGCTLHGASGSPARLSWDGSFLCHCSRPNCSCKPRPPALRSKPPKLQLWIRASLCSWGSQEQAGSVFPRALGLLLQEAGRNQGQAGALPLPGWRGKSSLVQLRRRTQASLQPASLGPQEGPVTHTLPSP